MPYHPLDVEIGRRIKSLRQEMQISQSELARALGITHQQVQKFEKGQDRISASALFHTALYLKTSVSYFFGDLPADELPPRRARSVQPESVIDKTPFAADPKSSQGVARDS